MTDETRVVRTNSLLDSFDTGVEGIVLTPAGVDVTEAQYKALRDVAFTNHVSIYLDEEFSSVPAGSDVQLEVPTPADPKLGGGSKAAPGPTAQKADGDTNGGSL